MFSTFNASDLLLLLSDAGYSDILSMRFSQNIYKVLASLSLLKPYYTYSILDPYSINACVLDSSGRDFIM